MLWFVDGETEGLISFVFKICCWGTFIGEELGFDIFGGSGGGGRIVGVSFFVRSNVGGVGVTSVA